jgi:DNA recombination protein RmuC
MTPIRESLGKVDAQIQQLERARVGAYESLTRQIEQLNADQRLLRGETSNLVSALRQPTVRGRWGEIQLRRVVELAGMLNYCDFFEQESVATEEGRLRPDLIVRLPGGRSVVIDSKVPLASYLAALEAKDDASRSACLAQHARQVRAHIGDLARKGYAAEVRQSAEFVVLFLPGEVFFSAALEQDPGLIEAGVDDGIVIATPTSLIALLRAVARGWRNEQVARNAEQISTLGKELYERLAKLGEHWGRVGKNLRQAVESFNAASGSLEGRVMVTARRFRELDDGLDAEALEALAPVDVVPRMLQDPDLLQRPVTIAGPAVVDEATTPGPG